MRQNRAMRAVRWLNTARAVVDVFDQMWREFAKVRNTGQVLAILRIFLQSVPEPIQGRDSKVVHFCTMRFSYSFQHVAQSYSQGHVCDQAVFHDPTEQLSSDVKFAIWILGKEAVFLKQIPQHAIEYFPFPAISRILKLL